MNRTPARLLVPTLIGAMLLGSLSGCFLLPGGPTVQSTQEDEEKQDDDAPSTEYATVGDCWDADEADMAEWAVWEGDDPVDCDEDHKSYTFFAAELKDDVEEAWDDGELTPELMTAVGEECDLSLRKLGIPVEAARVTWYYFVAPEDAWEDGDHSIRCDVAVTAIDSDWYDADLEDLPADIDELIRDIDDNPIVYELCIIGDGFGPYESTEAYLSDCAGDQYYWRYAGSAEYPETGDEPYPSEDYLFEFGNDECESLGARGDETVLPYVPTPDMWEAGDRVVYCWFSTVEEPSTPV